MKLYRTRRGIVVEDRSTFHVLPETNWDDLFNRPNLEASLTSTTRRASPLNDFPMEGEILAPIGEQEVWAAGVTYYRSRTARMDEAKDAGAGDFYDRVYSAVRPELFFKATPHRVVGPGQAVRLRSDSKWNVPEPELTLAINSAGQIIGYTIGNDMSSRDIEGENPLYLPQAKVYNGSCALGPCVLLASRQLVAETEVALEIQRSGQIVFAGATQLSSLKRTTAELLKFLMLDNSFPQGCFLLTGTGIVPPDEFTLAQGDSIRITIEPIGTLVNVVG
ncbi:MAG: fumarylacetoacetate hydrolase family protein [Acidobacteriota bacterium]